MSEWGSPPEKVEMSSEVSPFHCFPAIILYLYISGEVLFGDNPIDIIAERL